MLPPHTVPHSGAWAPRPEHVSPPRLQGWYLLPRELAGPPGLTRGPSAVHTTANSAQPPARGMQPLRRRSPGTERSHPSPAPRLLPRNVRQPCTDLTPSLEMWQRDPTTETAALTPGPVSCSSALSPSPGPDSITRASCTADTTRPSQAARPQASPAPREMGNHAGGRTRNTRWMPARFGSQTPDRIGGGLASPESSLGGECRPGAGEGEETSRSKMVKRDENQTAAYK